MLNAQNMKTSLINLLRPPIAGLAGLALLVTTPVGLAGDKPGTDQEHANSVSKSAKKGASAKGRKHKERVVQVETSLVTGSHIPERRAKRNWTTTAPLTVIDRRIIETSGASDLASLLRKRISR
jgi:hypothetical protein